MTPNPPASASTIAAISLTACSASVAVGEKGHRRREGVATFWAERYAAATLGAHRGANFSRFALSFLVSGAACAVLLGVPAIASACPTVSRVKSFSGTASLAFNGTVTGGDGHGGQTTMTLNHNATGLSVSIALFYPGLRPPYWQGPTSGGTMTVHDVYDDRNGEVDTHGQQDASGPSGVVQGAGLDFDSANCTYEVTASDSISTVTSGTGPHDPFVSDVALSPFMPTPGDFKLSGSVTISAYADPLTSVVSPPSGGFYQFGDSSHWGIAFAALTGNVDGPVGPATFSWNLTPTFYPPASPMCQVPHVSGLTLSAARRRLRNARCRVGKITRRHSPSIAKGRVISSQPSFGARRKVNTKITLTVSSGKHGKASVGGVPTSTDGAVLPPRAHAQRPPK